MGLPASRFSLCKSRAIRHSFSGRATVSACPFLILVKLQLGPVGKLVWPRYASSYSQLNGLGDVPWAVQIGGYAVYWPVPWLRVRGEVRQGIGGETGVSGDLFTDVVVPLGQWRLSGGPRLSLQSTAAVAPYFSITAAQSAASGLPVYNATGGFYSYGAGGQVEYFWNRQWQTHALVEYERISDSAANSPLSRCAVRRTNSPSDSAPPIPSACTHYGEPGRG